jgi:hypothetical protein
LKERNVIAYSLEFENGRILSKMFSSCFHDGYSQMPNIFSGFQVIVEVDTGESGTGKEMPFPAVPPIPVFIPLLPIPKERGMAGTERCGETPALLPKRTRAYSEEQKKCSPYAPSKTPRGPSLFSILV